MSKVRTTRKVYDAAMELVTKAADMPGTTALQLAGDKAESLLASGNRPEARFWSEVHAFLMMSDLLNSTPEFVDEDAE